MTINTRDYIAFFTVFAVLSVGGCKQQTPDAYLQNDNRYTFYYNGGTYLSLGIPTGLNIRVESEEYSISAGKNCETISTVINSGPEKYILVQNGREENLSKKSSASSKPKCTENILLDALRNLEITEKE